MNLSDKDFQWIIHPFTVFHPDKRNIAIREAKGTVLTDENGKTYLDAISSWWVNLHGHAHPDISIAVARQAANLEHVIFAGFTHAPAVHLAESLLSILPHEFQKLFYSDNGSTAVEVALKLAVQYYYNRGESRNTIVAFSNSYHGDTFGAMAVSERDLFVKPFEKMLFRVETIDIPSTYHPGKSLDALRNILKKSSPAAFIFEPLVQGAGGMRMYPADELSEMIRLCREEGVLCIADEVMTGFGRTGTYFAVDKCDVKPDLICLSKGLTGGYLPLGVTAMTNEIADAFQNTEASKTFYHGHSFTGNPISCAAAVESIRLLQTKESEDNRKRISDAHLAFASTLKNQQVVEDVRICGTILAFDVKTGRNGYFYTDPVKELIQSYCIDRGVLIRPMGNVVYILPPYCTTDEQLSYIYSTVTSSLKQF